MSKGFGKGRSATKFHYGYEQIAELANCSKGSVQKHAQRGHFDPADLLSVLRFIGERLQPTKGQDEEDQEEKKEARQQTRANEKEKDNEEEKEKNYMKRSGLFRHLNWLRNIHCRMSA